MTDNWLVEGADCIVIASSLFGDGYDRAQRGTVGKVGETHFTVVGVTASPIRPDLPLVRFRVTPDSDGRHDQAGDGRIGVYPPDSPYALAHYARKTAEDKVNGAHGRWVMAHRRRDDDRGAALYALADAAVALRAVYDEQGITDAREDQDR